MYSFKNDYSEGAHPRLLAALTATNFEQLEGYGEDIYSRQARQIIAAEVQCPHAAIHFLAGGTQTNLTAIAAFLRPHEAAVAADSGHVLVHETGAIEATGHKVISIASVDGKITASQVAATVKEHTDEHMVKPRLVYISQPTELGTVYNKAELTELSRYCRKAGLWLFVDGARLGMALCCLGNDVTLADLGSLTDAFYIGGTKNGALLGEALVICRSELQQEFRFHMKQRGALLAKGRIIGVQFLEMFKDGLYFELARQANARAEELRSALLQHGCVFWQPSPTNQLFPILPKPVIERLQANYAFYTWMELDKDQAVIRLVTSWATSAEAVRQFKEDLAAAIAL